MSALGRQEQGPEPEPASDEVEPLAEGEGERLESLVRRRIPRGWDGDIAVEEAGVLQQANGRPAGTRYVLISARSKLGRVQAALSIGSHVENRADEWREGWRRNGERSYLCLYRPGLEPRQPTVIEAAQEAPSASSSS